MCRGGEFNSDKSGRVNLALSFNQGTCFLHIRERPFIDGATDAEYECGTLGAESATNARDLGGRDWRIGTEIPDPGWS
jgi:hypothetical protein